MSLLRMCPRLQLVIEARAEVSEVHRVKKGTTVLIHILAFNRCKELWGDDALAFRSVSFDSTHPKVFPN